MTKLYRTILVCEFALAFWLPVAALALGIFIGFPVGIMGLFEGQIEALVYPMLTIGGLIGLWGVCQLLAKALDEEMNIARPKRLLFYIFSGCLAMAPFTYIAFEGFGKWSFILLMPYIVTGQLIYNNRGYFGY